jgi:hypothetical protein
MDYNNALEAEQLFQDLEKYKYVNPIVSRLKEIFMPIIENEKEKQFKRSRGIKMSWNNFHPESEISRAINALSQSVSFYEEAKSEIDTYQREQQDILHALELTDLDDNEMMNLMRDLQQVRVYRRQAKNFVETVEPLKTYAAKNKNLVNELGQIQKKTVARIQTINKKVYTCKEKKELQKAFYIKQSSPSKLALVKTS